MPERFPFGPSTRPECSAFWAWCGAIERYQMRYKDCLIRSPPFPLISSASFGSDRSSQGREAAKRTLDGEDRFDTIKREGEVQGL